LERIRIAMPAVALCPLHKWRGGHDYLN
jgi:hypothetical protein